MRSGLTKVLSNKPRAGAVPGAERSGRGDLFRKISEDQLKQFFFEFARFRPPAGERDGSPCGSIKGQGGETTDVGTRPARLDGIGQGVRVASLWYYSEPSLAWIKFSEAAHRSEVGSKNSSAACRCLQCGTRLADRIGAIR